MAIIFDECHRSQFGIITMLSKISSPKAQLFGFTGTPIIEENSIYKQIEGTIVHT
jgi:type I restriction enzyme R subunit